MNESGLSVGSCLVIALIIGTALLPLGCGTSSSGGGSQATEAPDDSADGDGSSQDGAGSENGTEDSAAEGASEADDETDSASADGASGDGEGSSGDDDRPEGWTEQTHSNDVPPDYTVVFPEDQVNRLDLTIAAEDWQAMQEDLEALYGDSAPGDPGLLPPGGDPGGPTQPGRPVGQELPPLDPPEEALAACEAMQLGGLCTVSMPDVEPIAGTCQSIDDGPLVCAPDAPQAPGPPEQGMVGGPIGTEENPMWAPCTVAFDGLTWWHVGLRFKGNSSLVSALRSGVKKLPLRLDFDEFEDDYPEIDDQRFFGFKKLSLGSGFRDPSLLREKVSHDIIRQAGLPAPRTAFYRLYVDAGEGPTYFGLYTMTEVPDDPMLLAQFGDDGGNLYKPSGAGADWTAFHEDSFDKESNEDEADWSDVQNAMEALHAERSNAADWRAGLEVYFDADVFIHWLAVNTVIQNWDTYGNTPQNYYLYGDPEDDGRLVWIPWDNNEALMSAEAGAPRQPLSLGLVEVGAEWPLIRYLIDDSEYAALYRAYVRDTIDGAFAVEATQQLIQDAHDLIEPFVAGSDGEQPGYTFLSSSDEFYAALATLLDHVSSRREAVTEFLGE